MVLIVYRMWGCRSNKDIVCELVNVPPNLLSYSCFVKCDTSVCVKHRSLSLRVFNLCWVLCSKKCGIVIECGGGGGNY